jgi:hypothetical protein
MNIPSGFSVEEIFKYCVIPDEVRTALQPIFDRASEQEEEIRSLIKHIEVIEEQLHFRDDFIRSTQARCESATRCKELVKAILTELDDSYIEL